MSCGIFILMFEKINILVKDWEILQSLKSAYLGWEVLLDIRVRSLKNRLYELLMWAYVYNYVVLRPVIKENKFFWS